MFFYFRMSEKTEEYTIESHPMLFAPLPDSADDMELWSVGSLTHLSCITKQYLKKAAQQTRNIHPMLL